MSESIARQLAMIVTGSSGLIGSAVVERLAGSFEVFAFDMKPPHRPVPDGAVFMNVDLADDASVQNAVAEVGRRRSGPLASVIHLAAYYDFSGEPSDKYQAITVEGTRRMLRAVTEQHPQQFLFSSTMLVHRPTLPGSLIREDSPLEPKWDYPTSKVETEQLIAVERGRIPALLLRIAGVYTDRCDSIPLSQQIQRIYEQKMTSHVFPGDTSHGQSFVHLNDLVDAIELAVRQRQDMPDITPILIGEPVTYSYQTLQDLFGRLIHGEDAWPTKSIPKALAKSGAWMQNVMPGVEDPFIKPWMIDLADDHFEISIDRARALLDWRPAHRLIDTAPHMVASLKADPRGWYAAHDLGEPPPVEKSDRAPVG